METEIEGGIGQDVPALNGAGSRLDAIRQRREEIARDKTLLLQVAGYDGLLAVRYKAIEGEEFAKLAERAEKSRDSNRHLHANADLLIRCCDEVMVRTQPDEELESIDPKEPVTFETGNLGQLLGYTAESAREEVFGLFSPGGARPLAVVDHGNAVISWMQGRLEEIDQALLGE